MNHLIYEMLFSYVCGDNFSQSDVCIYLFVVYDLLILTSTFDGTNFNGFISGCVCFLLKKSCFASKVKHLYI